MKENKRSIIIFITITLISFTLIHVDDINIFLNQPSENGRDDSSSVSPSDAPSDNPKPTNDYNDERYDSEVNHDVYLCDLEPIDGEFEMNQEPVKDVYDNEYDEYFDVFLADTLGLDEVSAEYAINGKYSFFTGTLFTNRDEGVYSAYKMEVYVDDSKVYTSPKMKLKTKPEKFEIPISGSNFIKIVFYFKDGNNGGPINGFVCRTHAGLYDAKLT